VKQNLQIKVCGITELTQLEALNEMPIDLVGLNFYPKSPRFINNDQLAITGTSLKKAGVFVNADIHEISEKAAAYGLDVIQLHGDESPDFVAKVAEKWPVIKAFGLHEQFDFDLLKDFEQQANWFLFDTSTKGYGGSGQKFNWQLLAQYTGNKPFWLSGGITLADIPEIKQVQDDRFIGIDINSGFEIAPGIKDLKLIKALTEELR
jgi:phosphoribosylanthranilate isomerase